VETLVEDPHPNPETTREFLGVILKNATRMNRLTEDLLALASVESPNYKVTPQPTRASALVEDAIESLGGMVVDSEVELESAGAPDALIMADPDAMNQVFGNLIENALKYGKAGGRIRVGAQLLESEVEFSVMDFGPGIAFEHWSASSSASIAWTRPALASPGAPDWGWRSSSTLCRLTGDESGRRASLAQAQLFTSRCRWRERPMGPRTSLRRIKRCSRAINKPDSDLNSNPLNIDHRQSSTAVILQGDSSEKFLVAIALLILCVSTAQAQKLTGAGATFPYPIYSKWFSEYSAAHPGVEINYQSIGSGGGIRQVTAGLVDFGAPTGR